MARAALIATRGPIDEDTRRRLDAFLPRLDPDNLTFSRWPVSETAPDLWIRGDASSFSVREHAVEVRGDDAGAQTMWWAKTERVFVASTSQRIVAAALGSFDPNRAAIAWMLSSGTLGPNLAWDRRVQPLAPGGLLSLDRKSFTLDVREPPIVFAAHDHSDEAHERALTAALSDVFAGATFDPERWIIPLSGGFDSRALILLSADPQRHRTVTWGTRAALSDEKSDAFIARAFASRLGLQHEYFELDLSSDPVEKIFERYLIAGEGRVDHFSGYLDGFRIWKHLHEQGVIGIIRGDEGFGWVPVSSASDVVHSVGMTALTDFAGAPSLEKLGLEGVSQLLPPAFVHRTGSGESLAAWRDRLYHAFRIPTILAALNDLKAPYVSVAAPLLDVRLLALVRSQPDHLRTSKVLFKQIVRARDRSEVPFASRSANADPAEILASRRMTEMLSDELSSSRARSLFNTEALLPRESRVGLRRRAVRAVKTRAKEVLPVWMRRAVRNRVVAHRLERRALAFRAFLAVRMIATLSEDAL